MESSHPMDKDRLHQLTELTLAHYERNADAFWSGTHDHDVSQNIDALLSHIETPAPYVILDFGCGPGRDPKTFTALGHPAIGLEGSARFVEVARQNSGRPAWHPESLDLDLPVQCFAG